VLDCGRCRRRDCIGNVIAPAKGSVTRKRIERRGVGCAEDVKGKLNEYTDTISEEYDTIKKGAIDLVEKGKEKAASVAGQYTPSEKRQIAGAYVLRRQL